MRYTPLLLFFMISELHTQHTIPKAVEKEILTALSFYPQLQATPITFKFKKKIKKSIMQARPTFWSFFKSKRNRSYVILISEHFDLADTKFRTDSIPSDILIGWFGHELGHIMDYRDRTKLGLLGFGFKYLFSNDHIIEAERAADAYAVVHGMEEYLIKTKNFILNQADLSISYRERIQKYYLSPDEIMELVEERDLKEVPIN